MSKRLWPAAIVLVLSGSLFAQQPPLAPNNHIRNIRFVNTSRLSASQKAQLIQDFEKQVFPAKDAADGIAVLVEQAVLAAYADKGYWYPKLKVALLPADDIEDGEVSVTVRAIDEGRQYKLRQLHWNGTAAFSESDLASMLPVHAGHVLERSALTEGIETVRRHYLAAGYLGFSAVPRVIKNQRDGTVDLQINLQEGGAFTVQSFDVIGLNPAVRERLLQSWPFKPGDVYRGENIENFLNVNAALLPAVSFGDVICRSIDLSNHTIEFVLDFRPQPLACNSEQEPEMTRQTLNQVTPAR